QVQVRITHTAQAGFSEFFLTRASLPSRRCGLNIIQGLIAAGVGIGVAVVLALIWSAVSRRRVQAQLAEAKAAGERIIEDAKKQAGSRVKEADLEAKEKLLQMRSDFDRNAQKQRDEIKSVERRLQQKEETLDKKTQQIDSRIAEVEKRDRAVGDREKRVEAKETELDALVEQQRHKLEQVAGLTA